MPTSLGFARRPYRRAKPLRQWAPFLQPEQLELDDGSGAAIASAIEALPGALTARATPR